MRKDDSSIRKAARSWLLYMSLEKPTASTRARFLKWRHQDPRHDLSYRQIESIWESSATLTDLARLIDDSAADEPHPRRLWGLRHWGWPSLAVAGTLAAGVLLLIRPAATHQHFETEVGQNREVTLSDGTRATLGGRTSLETMFSPSERRVVLTSGEVFLHVAKNPRRPFIVTVQDKEVRALGTQFDVNRGVDEMRVAVLEGRVEVRELPAASDRGTSLAPPSARRCVLSAGEEVGAPIYGRIGTPEAIGGSKPDAWRRGRFIYTNATLREIVADANRYSHSTVVIASPAIANIRLSVTYATPQVDQMLNDLPSVIPVVIEHPRPGELIVRAR